MNIINYNTQNPATSDQAVQQSPINDPAVQSNEAIKKTLAKKCKIHPQQNAELIHLVSKAQNVRICLTCAYDQNISIRSLLQIKDVLQASKSNQLITYPVLNDLVLLKTISSSSEIVDSIKDKVDKFFSNLKQQIKLKTKEAKQTHKMYMVQLTDLLKCSLDCLNEVASLEELRCLLLEQGDNEQKLAEFISDHLINSQANTQRLKQLWEQFETMKEQFSDQQPSEIADFVSSLLEEINFFAGPHPSPLRSVQQNKQCIAEVENIQKELDEIKQQLSLCKRQGEEDQRTKQVLVDDLKRDNQKKQAAIDKLTSEKQKIQNESSSQNNEIKANNNLKQQLDNEKNAKSLLSQQLTEIKAQLDILKQPIDLLPSTQLILSSLKNSRFLSVTKNNQQQLEFQNLTNERFLGQAFLNFILEPSINYVIQLKLDQTQGQGRWFAFGLIEDSSKDNITFGGIQKLSYYEHNGGFGINTLVKGKSIYTHDNSLETRSLEIRINIQRRVLQVCSLPNYESVVQADNPNTINPETLYRFFLFGLDQKSKMTITRLDKVLQFNSLI